MNEFRACLELGASRKRTLKALERRGFARWCPYGGMKKQGHWRITAEGELEAKQIFDLQQSFFIDTENGNDSNHGLSFDAPLKTWAEINRRCLDSAPKKAHTVEVKGR
jgi:hypothetical protein